MYAYFCFYINIIYIHIYIKQVIYRESSICLCDDKKKRNLAENKINVLLSDIMWLCAGVLVRRNRRLELNFADCKVDRPEEKKKKLLICSGYDTSSWPCAVFPNWGEKKQKKLYLFKVQVHCDSDVQPVRWKKGIGATQDLFLSFLIVNVWSHLKQDYVTFAKQRPFVVTADGCGIWWSV